MATVTIAHAASTADAPTNAPGATPDAAPRPLRARAAAFFTEPLNIFALLAALYAAGKAVFLVDVVIFLTKDNGPATRGFRVFGYVASPNHPNRDGWGLTYHGWAGVAHAATHALVLILGAFFLFSSNARRRNTAIVILFASALLWAGNGLYMATIADFEVFKIAAAFHFTLLVFTATAAARPLILSRRSR